MKTIWLGDDAHVSAYSAAVKGTDAVVTVKIKVTDTYALGHLLQDLERSKRAAVEERRAGAAAKAAARKPAAATRLKHHPLCSSHIGRPCDHDCARDFPQAIEHQQTRLLPYFGGERS